MVSANNLCQIFTLFFGGSPLIYTPSPRGDCSNCCPIKEPRDIQFQLYTRSNPDKPVLMYATTKTRSQRPPIDMSKKLYLYLHGFTENAPGLPGASSHEMRNALLKTGNFNVVLIDWSPLSAMPWYMNAVQNGPLVGRYIARFIRYLIKSGYPLENIHLIGFSLGATIAGQAGKTLNEWGIRLPRITGLDPAYPLYIVGDESNRLAASDAKFVDVIHTDGGILGIPWSLGHADFFPNGGVALQPGCLQQEISKNRWVSILIGCSHQRAWQYFVESLQNPKAFQSESCVPWEHGDVEGCDPQVKAYMGIAANPKLRGKFYLTTNEDAPYGRFGNTTVAVKV